MQNEAMRKIPNDSFCLRSFASADENDEMNFQYQVILAMAFIASSTSCTRNAMQRPEPFPTGRVFQIQASQAEKITFTRLQNGTTWSTDLVRASSERWKIQTAPDAQPLLDEEARSSFIEHLIDSVSTITNTQTAPKGSDEQLGLSRPEWMIRIYVKDPDSVIEMKIGSLDTQTSSYVSRISWNGKSEALLARGAFFGLLSHIKDFHYLRQPQLSSKKPSDVFVIDTFNGKSKAHHIERNVNEWIAPPHRDVTESVDAWLERVLNLRIYRFIDSKEEQNLLRKKLGEKAAYSIHVKDIQQNTEKWSFFRRGKEVFATSSSRQNLFFQLHPAAFHRLDKPF